MPLVTGLTTAYWRTRLLVFCATLLLASLWGTVAQTQFNLQALCEIGAVIEPNVRVLTSLQDIIGFGPLYTGIMLAVWLPAFASAAWLARGQATRRLWLYPLAAGIGLVVAIGIIDAVAPMPVLIYATRTWPGLLTLALGSALGAALFAYLTRVPPARQGLSTIR